MGSAALLVHRKRYDDVAVRLEPFWLVPGQVHNPRRCLRLIVTRLDKCVWLSADQHENIDRRKRHFQPDLAALHRMVRCNVLPVPRPASCPRHSSTAPEAVPAWESQR